MAATKRTFLTCAMLGMAIWLLISCGDPSVGKSFDVTAKVVGTGDNSIRIDTEVYGRTKLHDNYNTKGGSWFSNHERHYVGRVYDAKGRQISLDQLTPGLTVHVIGEITHNYERTDTDDDGTSDDVYTVRAVFWSATIVPQ
mgnify:CR=1 FL=1